MFRIKTLPGKHLSQRDCEAHVGEAMAMVKALNHMRLLGMSHSVRIAYLGGPVGAILTDVSDLFNNAFSYMTTSTGCR